MRAVRLDSGEVGVLARQVEQILDDAGLTDVDILVSGDMDEHRIELRSSCAPVDAWGVGTRLGTSGDAPWVDIVYKLEWRTRRSPHQVGAGVTLPGRKQVHRVASADGSYGHDVVALGDEEVPDVAAARAGDVRRPADRFAAITRGPPSVLPGGDRPPSERLRRVERAGRLSRQVRVSPGLEGLVNRLRIRG